MQFNLIKAGMQVRPTVPSLSKREKAALMTGEKVSLFVNKELVFRLPRKLLGHYSGTWKQQLDVEHLPVLCMSDHHKDAIKYVAQWMTAGGSDSTLKGAIPYPKDGLQNLVCLNRLAADLGIGPLKKRTLQSIDNYTRRHCLTLMLIQRVFQIKGTPTETKTTIVSNLKKWVGSRLDREWIKQGEEHPEAFRTALPILADMRKEVEQACAARVAKQSYHPKTGKPEILALPKAGKPNAGAKNLAKQGLSTKAKANKSDDSMKNSGPQPASIPIEAPMPDSKPLKKSTKATKAGAACSNCGQMDHTRPYCSNPRVFLGTCHTCAQQGHRAPECPSLTATKMSANPRVFLGKCHICAQQGHRAAECPSKTSTKTSAKEEKKKAVPAQEKGAAGQKSKNTKGTKANVEESNGILPPLTAKIVFVKDTGHTSAVATPTKANPTKANPTKATPTKATPTKGTSHKNPTAQGSSATDSSAGSQSSTSTSCTSIETEAPPNQTAEQENKPKKVYRFVTKKVCSLNITADGSVQREMVPGSQAKRGSSQRHS